MKLIELYNQLLLEIGERAEIPPGAKFNITEYKGSVEFDFMGDKYVINIRLPIKQGNIAIFAIDFDVVGGQFQMTNKNQMFKVMSYVVGSIEEWVMRYQKKFEPLQIVYIQYIPKSEEGEKRTSTGDNARDRIYRMYMEKFAKKYNSSVTFNDTVGIIKSIFNPKLEIR